MGGKEWAISLALGFVALPLGALIRLVPNEPCERFFVMLWLLPETEVQLTQNLDRRQYQAPPNGSGQQMMKPRMSPPQNLENVPKLSRTRSVVNAKPGSASGSIVGVNESFLGSHHIQIRSIGDSGGCLCLAKKPVLTACS